MTWQALRSVCLNILCRPQHHFAKPKPCAWHTNQTCQFPIPSVVIAVLSWCHDASKMRAIKNGLKQKINNRDYPHLRFWVLMARQLNVCQQLPWCCLIPSMTNSFVIRRGKRDQSQSANQPDHLQTQWLTENKFVVNRLIEQTIPKLYTSGDQIAKYHPSQLNQKFRGDDRRRYAHWGIGSGQSAIRWIA